MNGKLTVGSCFSGIGGLELGLEWTGGFETKWQIENDEYATKVLEKHWPNVKRYTDIRDVVRPETIDVICGGFPCQDVSVAGKRLGLEGKRTTLWSELFRLVCEIRPKWFLGENVPGLLSANDGQFFGNILRDLASIGYVVEWGVLSASGMGAPHLRKRVIILAYPNGTRRPRGSSNEVDRCSGYFFGEGTEILQEELANPFSQRWFNGSRGNHKQGKDFGITNERIGGGRDTFGKANYFEPRHNQWSIEPNMGRVAHGVPFRVDRLRCLGNAVVPQMAQKIGELILEAEKVSQNESQTP